MISYGINPSNAIKNILTRNKERLENINHSKKGIKTALVVQGGGMRGVFSAGSLIALEKMNLNNFDAVYSSSSGSVNASYFLSNQGPFGTSVYYEDINNSKFINFLRINKIMDIDYLFDEVLTYKKPLDLDKVTNSKTPLYFFATECDSGTAIRFNSKSKNLLQLIKASCAIPVYYNKPVFINGKSYLDGGICNAIPIEETIKDGCTDILVLLTSTVKSRKSLSFFEKFLIKNSLSKFNSELFDAYLTGFKNCNYAFDICIGKRKVKNKVNIATIVPDDNFRLHRLTKNDKLLKNAAVDGARKVFDLFNKNYDMREILRYD